MAQSNGEGPSIIAASRRPDGTLRKERRIRPGYVPQEEQEVYVSKGAMFQRDAGRVPGFDPTAAQAIKAAAAAANKSKSAKKNEKRKEKKQAATSVDASDNCDTVSQSAAEAALQRLDIAADTADRAPEPAVAIDSRAGLEKQLRALRKKVRQCHTLQEELSSSNALTSQEEQKLANRASWEAEVAALEQQLSELRYAR